MDFLKFLFHVLCYTIGGLYRKRKKEGRRRPLKHKEEIVRYGRLSIADWSMSRR